MGAKRLYRFNKMKRISTADLRRGTKVTICGITDLRIYYTLVNRRVVRSTRDSNRSPTGGVK